MTRTLRGLLFLSLLAAASVALGLHIRDVLLQPAGLPEVVSPIPASGDAGSNPAAVLPALPEYDPPPINQFAAAVERPLFSPDRRPPAETPSVVVASADQALTATLSGILFADSGSVALLTAVGDSTPVRVSQGDEYLGWRLSRINPDNVVFERNGEQVTLELIYRVQPESDEPGGFRRTQRP